ncbi:MAG: VOC family protein, partial [Pseudomonadota bacterium]
AANVAVRVIEVDSTAPVVRPEASGRHVGGLSIGFPMHDIDAREEKLAAMGIPSSVGRKDLEFQSPTGETYTSSEIHFIGPEDVYLLGVKRPDGLTPVGPMPGGTPIGAPAYSARCVTDADLVNRFFVEQLGFECRRDMALTVGSPSGLKLEPGSVERFIQLFAPGAATGYLVLLDHGDITVASPAPSLGPPSRGVAMWTFATDQIEHVREQVSNAGCRIIAELSDRSSPLLASKRSFIVEDPDQFPVEIVEL